MKRKCSVEQKDGRHRMGTDAIEIGNMRVSQDYEM